MSSTEYLVARVNVKPRPHRRSAKERDYSSIFSSFSNTQSHKVVKADTTKSVRSS